MQIEQPVAVQIQLRRPSDGAVSESRAFEFLPLDPGRAYWSAKRLKTNYSVFSQILTRDQQQQQQQPQQQQQQQELKHKVPLSRAPVMAGVFATPGAGADSEPSGDTAVAGGGQVRQPLRPVAMPGAGPPQVQGAESGAKPAAGAVSQQLPVRAPQKAPMFDPAAAAAASARPASDLSLMSDFSSLTQCDNLSLATRQSVNDILSLADVSVYSGDTLGLDTASVTTLLLQPPAQPQAGLEVKEEPLEAATLLSSASAGLGSLTSVATVKENKPQQQQQQQAAPASFAPMDVADLESPGTAALDTLDLDIGQIYDDVMQCVYDDVDIKYDDVTMLLTAEQPPVPPTRRQRETNIDADIAELDKPLPAAPRNNILTKLTEKKNEMMTVREKELERKKKEREELEEQKRKEREEKEKKKKEEREAKKREEEEKKAKLDEQKIKSSLFQRLFQRSQSRNMEAGDLAPEDEAMVTEDAEAAAAGQDPAAPPPVPQHQAAYLSQASMDARLSELEQLITAGAGPEGGAGAGLERLEDNIVTEFTRQFQPEAESQPVQS